MENCLRVLLIFCLTLPAWSKTNSRGDTKLYNSSRPCVLVDPGFIVCGGQVQTSSGATAPVVNRDSRGRIARSSSAKKLFRSQTPCPANGRTRGRCPGYVIDHIVPLVCGGLDDPSNMQFQTVEDGKAKDKWERKRCGK